MFAKAIVGFCGWLAVLGIVVFGVWAFWHAFDAIHLREQYIKTHQWCSQTSIGEFCGSLELDCYHEVKNARDLLNRANVSLLSQTCIERKK